MEILNVEKYDRDEIINVSKGSQYITGEDYIEDVFDTWLKSGIFLKATEKNEILGFLHIRIFDTFIWLEGLRVSGKHKRKGVGSALTQKAIDLSGKRKIRMIILDSNIPSINLVKKFNFHEIDRIYYNIREKMPFIDIIKKYDLKKLGENNKDPYLDDWAYFDNFYYKKYVYGNEELKILDTDPPFVINGSIEEEHVSKLKGDECFIVFERNFQ